MTLERPLLSPALTRTLCIVVIAVMIVAAAYATWIGISNFNRIRV